MTAATSRNAELWHYSMLAIPIAFAGFPLYVLAPDYYATTHGVSLTLLGFLLLALRVFDAIQDPLIGALSDRYRHGSKRFMSVAAIMLCISIYGLFNLMPMPPAVWFSLCIVVAVSAYSVLSINLNALGGLWTKDPSAQTRIATAREGCGLIGQVIAVSLPSLLGNLVGEQRAYLYFSIILAIFMLVAWLAFLPWLSKNTPQREAVLQPSYSLVSSLNSISRNTRCFLSIYGLSMLASAIPAVLVIFFVRDLLGAEQLTAIFLLLYFISGAASMVLWKRISAYCGKHRAWGLAMLLAVAGFVWAFFLDAGDIWQYGLICVFTGLALGADLALPPAIIADHIHKEQAEPSAATHYAILALTAKLSLAVASGIALPLLEKTGFVPATQNGESSLMFLSAAYALIPCALKLAAAVLLARMFIYSKHGDIYENNQVNSAFRSSHHA